MCLIFIHTLKVSDFLKKRSSNSLYHIKTPVKDSLHVFACLLWSSTSTGEFKIQPVRIHLNRLLIGEFHWNCMLFEVELTSIQFSSHFQNIVLPLLFSCLNSFRKV